MSARAFIIALPVSCAVALGVAGVAAAPTAPVAAPTARADASRAPAASNDECISCHADVAREWSTSLHRASFSDATFQRGYAFERDAFCRGCHAPTAAPSREPDTWSADNGVACITCHGDTPREAHANVARARASCDACHEFAFPGGEGGPPRKTAMQLTVTEHRASPFADRSCASCHMPREGRRASHRFTASRDERALKGALATKVERDGNVVIVTLTPRDVGHAFPTGDMFRRVTVNVETPNERQERRFMRTFAIGRGTKVTAEDSRLTGRATLRFPLKDARDARVRVRYQRFVTAPARGSETRERLESETTLYDEAVR